MTSPELPNQSVASTLERLFEDCHDGLMRLAYVLTGDGAQSADLVQDAFVALGTRPKRRWPAPGSEYAYLRMCVINGSRRHWRREAVAGRARRVQRETAFDSVDSVGLDRAGQRRVADAVRGLPRRQRECIVLRYHDEMPIAEIAHALGISEGSVKTCLHRAHRALAEMLGDMR